MACTVVPGPVAEASEGLREAVCIHTKKIIDACRDKDCAEDLCFYPTEAAAAVLETALTVKGSCSELLYVYVDVEPICFNRGYYTIDMRFFYRVTLQAYQSTSARGVEIEGLSVFDKRCILFGSEGGSKAFTSEEDCVTRTGRALPIGVVEAVDPIVLGARMEECDPNNRRRDCCPCDLIADVPPCIADSFSSPLVVGGEHRRVLVTLGQFSIVRLERDTQLLIPVYDYCLPEKECSCGSDDDPCDLFRGVAFPVNEFFPPNALDTPTDYRSTKDLCCCKS